MLPATTIGALTAALAELEARAEADSGWDAWPSVWGLFAPAAGGPVLAAELPIPGPLWSTPDPDRPGLDLPTPVAFRLIVAFFASDAGSYWITEWERPAGHSLLAVAYLDEYLAGRPFEGYEYGDLRAVPPMAERELRAAAALDVDGRLHDVRRIRGEQSVTTTVINQPAARQIETHVVAALQSLLTLCAP